jgi:multicomponent K+:H+ antiporter subunit D
MSHWIIAPLLLPPLVGAVMITSMRHHLALERVFSVSSISLLLAFSVFLLAQSNSGMIQAYEIGAWPAPFGIVLVLDRLAAMMIVLTALIALAVVLYAIGADWDRRGRHFHALMQFQLMGLFGAFLTGDLFNLFVFFEILLIASYGLMIHGGGTRRLQAGVQYVVYNLLGSTLFLFALGTIYAVTGTLNMADLAVRVGEISPHSTSLVRVAAALLLLVFAVKAAVVPLHFWLPATYAEAPGPVAALFAIMTKVGVYAILRVFNLIFGAEAAATGELAEGLLLPVAFATLALGTIGVMGAPSLGRLAAMATIGSVGTLMIAVGFFSPQTTAAALYYMIHSTLASAMLFLVVDLVRQRRENGGDGLSPGLPIFRSGIVSAIYLAGAIGLAGLPPLSGFVGKLLILGSVRSHEGGGAAWAMILLTSLALVVGFARAGIIVFWHASDSSEERVAKTAPSPSHLPLVAALGLLGLMAAITVLARPVTEFLQATSQQIHDPALYVSAVGLRTGDQTP